MLYYLAIFILYLSGPVFAHDRPLAPRILQGNFRTYFQTISTQSAELRISPVQLWLIYYFVVKSHSYSLQKQLKSAVARFVASLQPSSSSSGTKEQVNPSDCGRRIFQFSGHFTGDLNALVCVQRLVCVCVRVKYFHKTNNLRIECSFT